ncbi:unnamed protein product [Effrenium voratum]|uniref:Uncharacterized protein n=1 Tax=Effrenium voratum TaxID=2562239 RepID=A0AA36I4A9_9DINO|nr:unnamed protein product [Effrenium voratum]
MLYGLSSGVACLLLLALQGLVTFLYLHHGLPARSNVVQGPFALRAQEPLVVQTVPLHLHSFGAAPPSPPAPARVALRAVRGARGAAEQVAAKPAPAPAWRGASNGSAPEKPCWYQEEATRGTGMTWSFGPPLRLRMRLAGFGALGLEVANTGRKSGARVEVALAGHALPSIAPGETCHLVLAFRDLELGAASLELLDLRSQVQVFAHHCPKKVEGPPLEVLGLAGLTPLCREGQQVWVGWSGCSASGHDWC